MIHHDAITGTHKFRVGENYKEMMRNIVDSVLYNGSHGVVGSGIKKMAYAQGFKLEELNLC